MRSKADCIYHSKDRIWILFLSNSTLNWTSLLMISWRLGLPELSIVLCCHLVAIQIFVSQITDTFSWQEWGNNLLWASFRVFNLISYSYISGVKKVGDHWSKKCHAPLLGELKIISSNSVDCQLKSTCRGIIVKQKIWNPDNAVYIIQLSKNLVYLALLTDLECKSLKLVQIKFSKFPPKPRYTLFSDFKMPEDSLLLHFT